MFEELDWQSLGTAVAILTKTNPVAALATGVVSGILGKVFFDKAKQSKKEKEENRKILEDILNKKEKDNGQDIE